MSSLLDYMRDSVAYRMKIGLARIKDFHERQISADTHNLLPSVTRLAPPIPKVKSQPIGLLHPFVEIKYAHDGIKRLVPSTSGSAGYDLQIDIDTPEILICGNQKFFGTGISIHINNPNYAGIIIPRSGLGVGGLVIGNTIGLIDSDYQGEIRMTLLNRNKHGCIKLEPYMRVAQLVVLPVCHPVFKEVKEFSCNSERGSGGFGSTGVK